MSLCEFEDIDAGGREFRCAQQATHRVRILTDLAGNPPYEKLYCPEHAEYYLEPRRTDPREQYIVAPLPGIGSIDLAPHYAAGRDGDDDDF